MKILIWSHSASPGGAENALRRLVKDLSGEHEVHVVLPALESHEGAYYKRAGVRCFELQFTYCLPNFSNGLLAATRLNLQAICETLKSQHYDLLISNTMAILHGNLIAHLLDVPHVTYAHEYLDDPELLPTAIDRSSYVQLVQEGSSGLMTCSHMVMKQFACNSRPPRLVWAPYDYSQPPVDRPPPAEADWVLQVIGVQSYRKNIVFAVNVVKALKVLGHSVRLDIIGRENNASAQIRQQLRKRGINYRLLPHQEHPFAHGQNSAAITLVCSHTEPYGLTIPESLRLGIPVVASDCGGPAEILQADRLFPVDDVDACVRMLLTIWQDYESACQHAGQAYRSLHESARAQDLRTQLNDFMHAARRAPRSGTSQLQQQLMVVRQVADMPIGIEHLTQSVTAVAAQHGIALDRGEVERMIAHEKLNPGAAVQQDLHRFKAIPFAMSEAMDRLYREGFGLAIELAASFNQAARLQMAAFIACHLWQSAQRQQGTLSVLALGDGAGMDSLRLAHAGFDVDYMDYDQSHMSRIAAMNFAAYSSIAPEKQSPAVIHKVEKQYDAVVCLEVIEHVLDPDAFITFMAKSVKPGGRVYISECFNGVEDRWPTHLAANERYAGMLPFMMTSLFSLETMHRQPHAKPYVFRKRAVGETASAMELLSNKSVLADLVKNQINIGI